MGYTGLHWVTVGYAGLHHLCKPLAYVAAYVAGPIIYLGGKRLGIGRIFVTFAG